MYLRPTCRGSAAALIALLSLSMTGCATVGQSGPGERQAVIDRIVAVSAKVLVEHAGRRVSSGSGVVVASAVEKSGSGAASYILTAAHLLDGKRDVEIFVRFTGSGAPTGKFLATVKRWGNPENLDLALLLVPGVTLSPVPFADDAEVRLGEEILVVGFPWGKRLALFSGIISQVPADGKEDPTGDDGSDRNLMVDAAVGKGVSGGGVFLAGSGKLLGVVEGYQTASIAVKGQSQTYSVKVPMPGETFVVPVVHIRRFLDGFGLDPASERPRTTRDLKE